MRRERALKIVVVVGLFFVAGIYPIVMYLWRPGNESPGRQGDAMMVSLYVMLAIFLRLAVRGPSGHRSPIVYAGWANIAHATVMALMAIHPASDRRGLLTAVAIQSRRCSPDHADAGKAVSRTRIDIRVRGLAFCE